MRNAIAFGTFDGVHIAHRKVLDLPDSYKKVAVTFEIPPKMFFTKNYELIMPFEQKQKVLNSLGFNEILALDFETVKDMPLNDFLLFICEKYNPALISCGFDYRLAKALRVTLLLFRNFAEKRV